MQQDIVDRVKQEYGENADSVLKSLEAMCEKLGDNSRIARCVLQLSKGNLDQLDKSIKEANEDWRDVILWADKDGFDSRKQFSATHSFE